MNTKTDLGAALVVTGLILDYRVFYQTLNDIRKNQNMLNETKNEVNLARNRLSNVTDNVFSINSSFDSRNNLSTVPSVPQPGVLHVSTFGSDSLEDVVEQNQQSILDIRTELEDLRNNTSTE